MDGLRQEFLKTADRIGALLCRDAIWEANRCNWLGASAEELFGNWLITQRTFGPDLYGGTSGIALFLARLFTLTKENLFRVTAEGAIEQAMSRMDDLRREFRAGFYSGVPGICYTLTVLGELFDRERWISDAFGMLGKSLSEDRTGTRSLDVTTGIAGVIPLLLLLHRQHGMDSLLESAIALGDELLRVAKKSDVGWSWNTMNAPPDSPQPYLTGFAHGTAGIGWALNELFGAAGEKRFELAGLEAFRYERRWFSVEHENWPDFRSAQSGTLIEGSPLSYSTAWCHGAPGIGLSRLRTYDLLGDEECRKEAECALRTTLRALAQSLQGQDNYCLCHGLAGNAELFLYASQVLGNGECLTLAHGIGKRGIDVHEKANIPWPSGLPGGVETPNLMLGLAGTGYFYLRLHDPDAVPSVLILLPSISPRARHD